MISRLLGLLIGEMNAAFFCVISDACELVKVDLLSLDSIGCRSSRRLRLPRPHLLRVKQFSWLCHNLFSFVK